MNQSKLSPEARGILEKTNELKRLGKRTLKRWNKLVEISFRIAQERGIEIKVIENYEDQINSVLDNPEAIQLYTEEDEYNKGDDTYMNADKQIELAKDVVPFLYKRYHEGLRKYKIVYLVLEKLMS